MQLSLPGENRVLRNIGIDCMMAAVYPDIGAFVSFRRSPSQTTSPSVTPSRK
jgi:hypothetical protein